MKKSAMIFIDGQEVKRLEGEQKERKAYAEAFKRLKERFQKFEILEHQPSEDAYWRLLSGCETVLDITPNEKLGNAIAHVEVHLSVILGRRIVLAEIRSKIEEALEKFKETRSNEDFFNFRALVDQYRSLLNNHYREIRSVLAKLKIPGNLLTTIDFRYLLRMRSKLISRNVDDEDSFRVKIIQVSDRLHFTLNSLFHGQQIYRGNYLELGSFLQ